MTAILNAIPGRWRAGPGEAPASAESADSPVTEGDVDERLVALFRNRAELKKAFMRLQRECDELRARLQAVDSDPDHEPQRLAALEQRLSERDTGYAALVYYQLRGLWRFCHNLLVEFSEQLQEQHHEREYAAHREAVARQRDSELLRLDERTRVLEGELARLQRTHEDQQRELAALTGFWNRLKRRRLSEAAQAQWQRVEAARERLGEVQAERRARAEAAGPPFPGLSLAVRRNVNLAVLAFAQYLYVEFQPNGLSRLSHTASSSGINEVSYGSRQECVCLMELIERAVAAMADKRGYADELKLRAMHLRRRAAFESADATIPAVESLENFPLEFHDGQAGVQVDVNVLELDYWHVRRVLLA